VSGSNLHSRQTIADGIHTSIAYEYADAAARTGATGFVAEDVGKFALQLDDNSIWVLRDTVPTWQLVAVPGGSVPTSRTLTAGAGLTGGGDLSADRTFNVVANADGSITVNADDIQVGVLATDAQHGVRGGGTQHAVATPSVAGFMSAADKVKLDASTGGQGPTPLNKAMAAVVTGGDGSLATIVAFFATPLPTSWVEVLVNGVSYQVGNGTKFGVPCYFSGDGGSTARATGFVVAGDFLYWNGSVATFQLSVTDRIDFEYEPS
jgi:hypothetical protein